MAGAVSMGPSVSEAATRVVVRGPVATVPVSPVSMVYAPVSLPPVVVKPVVVAPSYCPPVVVHPSPVTHPVVVASPRAKVVVKPGAIRVRY